MHDHNLGFDIEDACIVNCRTYSFMMIELVITKNIEIYIC